MGIIKAFSGAIRGSFADQWKDIITVAPFDEYTVVSPGVLKAVNQGRGSNLKGSYGVISNGSKIYVPENTAAIIYSDAGIETVITESGGYEYQNGEASLFNGDGIQHSLINPFMDRVGYGGIPSEEKRIIFVNLREIRNIKFGTRAPLLYHDYFYDADLEIRAFGSFSIQITKPTLFIQNYLPANEVHYSFADFKAREQLVSELLHSLSVALNALSSEYRITDLPSQTNRISDSVRNDHQYAGSWENRFGISIVQVSIENIAFSDNSQALIQKYTSNRLDVSAFENVSQKASNIASQQKIARGIQDHGLNGSAGMIMGMNIANDFSQSQVSRQSMSFEQQIDALKKLKELFDAGILTSDEFNKKKKEIIG